MELRENQKEPARIGVEFFKNTGKVEPSIIIAPTAFGKSVLISYIANAIEDKVLVIQPNKELLEQNYNKLLMLGGQASIYSASMNSKEIGHITYATVGSIYKIGHKFKELGIKKIIIDECDRFPRDSSGMLRTFVRDSKATHVLGLTATPLKLQTLSGQDRWTSYSILRMLTKRSSKGVFFKHIIHVTQIKEMLELGFWTKLEYIKTEFKDDELVYNTTGSDYTEDSINASFEDNNMYEKIIDAINNYSDRRSILVAVPRVKQAVELAQIVPNSIAVYGDMDPKERKKAIDDFKNFRIRVVFQVNVLSVGFDHPELDMLISARPTASLSWWYQFVGRATRIHPNKKDALVIDFAGNYDKFGKVEDFVYEKKNGEWHLVGKNNNLLTEVDIRQIGNVKLNIGELNDYSGSNPIGEYLINFGAHRGKMVKDVPRSYLYWMFKNFDWSNPKSKELKNEIERYLYQESMAL